MGGTSKIHLSAGNLDFNPYTASPYLCSRTEVSGPAKRLLSFCLRPCYSFKRGLIDISLKALFVLGEQSWIPSVGVDYGDVLFLLDFSRPSTSSTFDVGSKAASNSSGPDERLRFDAIRF